MNRLALLFAIRSTQRRWKRLVELQADEATLTMAHYHFMLTVRLASGELNGRWFLDATRAVLG